MERNSEKRRYSKIKGGIFTAFLLTSVLSQAACNATPTTSALDSLKDSLKDASAPEATKIMLVAGKGTNVNNFEPITEGESSLIIHYGGDKQLVAACHELNDFNTGGRLPKVAIIYKKQIEIINTSLFTFNEVYTNDDPNKDDGLCTYNVTDDDTELSNIVPLQLLINPDQVPHTFSIPNNYDGETIHFDLATKYTPDYKSNFIGQIPNGKQIQHGLSGAACYITIGPISYYFGSLMIETTYSNNQDFFDKFGLDPIKSTGYFASYSNIVTPFDLSQDMK